MLCFKNHFSYFFTVNNKNHVTVKRKMYITVNKNVIAAHLAAFINR